MTPDALRLSLLLERFGQPVPQWHPGIDDLLAAGERIELLTTDEREDRKSA